ncbi:SCO family protein [Massilia sp. DD77]|uniref:SCO family protein n=1 Tax=Massilia sp. DD77 TaxID=3109349 RepID=UPI003000341B
MIDSAAADPAKARSRGRWKLFLVLLVCASPLIASYLAYYVIKPEGRTNYGAILDPRQHPIPKLDSTTLDGRPRSLEQMAGKWLMVRTGGGACLAACREQLHAMRQWRLMQGKNMDRIERVWLVTDEQPVDSAALRGFKDAEGAPADLLEGVTVLRAPAAAVAGWLPAESGASVSDHVYLIDPLGNLMMRFPKTPDPRKVYKDIAKLLKASAIG